MARLQTWTIGGYQHDDEMQDEVEVVLRQLTPFRIHPSLLNLEAAQAEGAYGTVWRGMLYSIAANQIPSEATGRIEKGGREGLSWFIMEAETETRHVVLCETSVAVKKLKLRENVPVQDVKRRFAREMHVWSTLDHANISSFLGFHLDLEQGSAWLVSFWQKEGSLQIYLANNQLSRNVAMNILEDVSLGLAYLHGHSPPIVHGDIKPGNVLITRKGKAQLCDFGLAEILDSEDTRTTTSRFRGSIRWSSPEILNGFRHNTASDVWAFGVLSYQVATNGRLPFHGKRLDTTAYMKYVMEDQLPSTLNALTRRHPALISLIRGCWSTEPSERPSIQACYEHIHSRNTAVLDAQTEFHYRLFRYLWDVTNALAGLSLWVTGGVYSHIRKIPQSVIAGLPVVYIAFTIFACVIVRVPHAEEFLRDEARQRAKSALNGDLALLWWGKVIGLALLFVAVYAFVGFLSVWTIWAS